MRSSSLVVVALVLAVFSACGPGADPGNGDGGQGSSCTGNATRCNGLDYQTCVNDTFTTQTSCASACTPTMGCTDCDPAAGSDACDGSDVVVCNADGTFGSTVKTCSASQMCVVGTCSDMCTADGVDLVYAVDEANDFLSFDPRKLMTTPATDPFTKIGTLSCHTTGASLEPAGGAVTPQSMSVDRNGVAWVEYTNGQVFNVSLTDASCTATSWVPQAGGFQLFGMGFSTDTMGGNTETLFLGGGGDAAQASGQLAYVVPANNNLTPTTLGTLTATADYSPELTGTSQAKLFGFYPNKTAPAYVQEINKANGAPVGTAFNLGTTGLGANVRDWAFAQWGGTFYVFVTTADETGLNETSTVRAIDGTTGAYSVVIPSPTFKNIDGAGVSTCAPTMIE